MTNENEKKEIHSAVEDIYSHARAVRKKYLSPDIYPNMVIVAEDAYLGLQGAMSDLTEALEAGVDEDGRKKRIDAFLEAFSYFSLAAHKADEISNLENSVVCRLDLYGSQKFDFLL